VIGQMELRLHNRRLDRIHREQQTLFATLAHDLRTPFNGILGLSKHLSRKAETLSPARITQLAHGVLSSSLQVYQLLDELLQWSASRYSSKSSHLSIQPLLPLIERSTELYIDTMALKNITFNCNVKSDLSVCADATLTKTIIRNLLANAIKFTPENLSIDISAEPNDSFVEIRVSNNGSLIPEDTRKNLFSQTVASEKGTMGETGNGLGLKLMQEFVETQGGKIWLEQNEPDTNTFCFTLQHPSSTTGIV
jgi:Osmosensitive K+ channel histidine kinase